METGQMILSLQSFGIQGFCEQGIFFKVESQGLILTLVSTVIFLAALFLNFKYATPKNQAKGRKKHGQAQTQVNHVKGLSRRMIGIMLSLTLLMSIGCFMAADLFTYFICFQILLLVSYLLVVERQTAEALRAGNGYLTYGLLTGMVMLMGMFLLSHDAGTTRFEDLTGYVSQAANKNMVYLTGTLFLVGFIMNAGLFPLHTWQDKVYREMSGMAGGFLASIVNKAGLVGIWMMSYSIFKEDVIWNQILVTLGFVTVLIACIHSFLTPHVKEALGFGTVAGMGVLVAGIGSGADILYPMILQMMGSFLVFSIIDYLEKQGMEGDLQLISKQKLDPPGASNPILILGFAIGTVLLSGLAFWVSKLSVKMTISFMLFGILILMSMLRLFVILFTPADERKNTLCKREIPVWLSLEKYIYEPLVMRLLPFICAVILRACDKLVDGMVTGLRKTIFKDKKQRVWDKVGTPFTYICGVILDDIIICLNKTFFRKRPIRICFVNELAYLKSGLSLTSKIVVRSVSFGLLMFCIGLCLTIGYLLVA